MHLFLQGERRIGKSTLLRNQLLPHIGQVAGFAVQRVLERGEQVGFRAVTISCEDYPPLECALEPDLPGLFILRGQSYPSVLEQTVAAVCAAAADPRCKLILLDEIGGLELDCHAMMQMFHQLLSLGKPCIGVLKSRSNLLHTATALGLAEDLYTRLHWYLEKSILQNGQILTLLPNNHAQVQAALQNFLEQIWLK